MDPQPAPAAAARGHARPFAVRADEPHTARPDASRPTEVDADRLTALEAEIKSLRERAAGSSNEPPAPRARHFGSWFNTSVMISFTALLFSFGTTVASYHRTQQQDLHDARTELRGFLQRLIALPSDMAEGGSNSAALNAENTLLANQAAEVMHRIPEYVSATEYNVVASAFLTSSLIDRSEEMLKKSLLVAKNVEEEVAAVRIYAMLLVGSGKVKEGRDMFRRALAVHRKYPSNYPSYADWTDAQTEMHWAGAEFGRRNCDESQAHLKKAFALAARLPPGSGTNYLQAQLVAAQQTLESCAAQNRPTFPQAAP